METIEDTIVEHAKIVVAEEVQGHNVKPEVKNEEGRKRKRV